MKNTYYGLHRVYALCIMQHLNFWENFYIYDTFKGVKIMPAGISENGKLMVELVEENPGKMKRQDIIDMFDRSEHRSVAISLGRLLGEQSRKLYEDENGHIYPATDEDQVVESAIQTTIPNHLSVPPIYSEKIDIPEVARKRDMEVVFKVQLRVKSVKRIGLATNTHVNKIVWLPIGSALLKAKIGDDVSSGDELMSLKYLVVVTSQNNGYFANFYQPPAGENFVLAWED